MPDHIRRAADIFSRKRSTSFLCTKVFGEYCRNEETQKLDDNFVRMIICKMRMPDSGTRSRVSRSWHCLVAKNYFPGTRQLASRFYEFQVLSHIACKNEFIPHVYLCACGSIKVIIKRKGIFTLCAFRGPQLSPTCT